MWRIIVLLRSALIGGVRRHPWGGKRKKTREYQEKRQYRRHREKRSRPFLVVSIYERRTILISEKFRQYPRCAQRVTKSDLGNLGPTRVTQTRRKNTKCLAGTDPVDARQKSA